MGHHYRRSYETVLVAQKKGAACKWYGDTKDFENVIRPGDYGIKKIIPQANQHPTEKPVELPALFIYLHSQEGDIIFDPFVGSGSTLVAAERYKRKWIGCEIEQVWIDMANMRINQYKAQGKLF